MKKKQIFHTSVSTVLYVSPQATYCEQQGWIVFRVGNRFSPSRVTVYEIKQHIGTDVYCIQYSTYHPPLPASPYLVSIISILGADGGGGT
jgi:hypothetical protein